MIRTVTMAERSVFPSAPLLVVVAANSTTSGATLQPPDSKTYNGTQIVPDYSKRPFTEVQMRHIQNTSTTNNCFIVIGQLGCDASNYHYVLAPLQVLDVSNHLKAIWAFCNGSGGTTISYVEYYRTADNTSGVATNPFPNQ